jgi:hypothetical protein
LWSPLVPEKKAVEKNKLKAAIAAFSLSQKLRLLSKRCQGGRKIYVLLPHWPNGQ